MWGLSDVYNYPRWDYFLDPDPMHQQNALNELQFRYNLTYEEADMARLSYITMFNNEVPALRLVTNIIKDCPDYTSFQCVAYTQWATSAFSLVFGEQSFTGVVDTVTGYPEMNYFNKALVNQALNNAGNKQLADYLLDVEFYKLSL